MDLFFLLLLLFFFTFFCSRMGRRRRRRICKQPHHKINIMTRLRQQRPNPHPRLPAPVPPHIRVRKVPPPDGLDVLEGDDVADDVVVEEELAEEEVVRAVAEDVADGEDLGLFLLGFFTV